MDDVRLCINRWHNLKVKLATAIFLFGQIIDDHRWFIVASSMIFIIGDDHRVYSYDLRFSFEAMIIDDHRWFEIIGDRLSMIIVPQRWSSKIDRLQRWCINDLPVAVFDHRVIIGQIHHRWSSMMQRFINPTIIVAIFAQTASMMHRWCIDDAKKCKLKIQSINRNKNWKLLLDVHVVKGSMIIDDQCVSTMITMIIDDHRWSSMINADEKDFHELQIMNNIFLLHMLSFQDQPSCHWLL